LNIYIATHGEKGQGANPGLTETGKAQIAALPIPDGITQVVVGTGRRFCDILAAVKDRVGNVPVKYSPLCGSADSGEKSETGFNVTLADGTSVEIGGYIGLIGTPGIDLVAWLGSLPDNTLLCAGREFLGGIGFKTGVPGRLYRYDGSGVTEVA
jgi:hypothetical protein